MDAVIIAAAQALAVGNPLGALKRVALREDAAALALRGIAIAQLGDFERAKALLKRARRAFRPDEAIARARCVVAEAEIALVSRDLRWPQAALGDARTVLGKHGDRVNEAHAQQLEVRRLLLIGKLGEAERELAELDPSALPAALLATHELAAAGIAMRRIRAKAAREALARAGEAALAAGIPALMAEVENAAIELDTPAARWIVKGEERLLRLDEVEALMASPSLVIDACRLVVRRENAVISLARRPVLFALVRALGEAWPGDATREVLLAKAFEAKQVDESHRARLRVEIGRLRTRLDAVAKVNATPAGFSLAPPAACEVSVLAPPVEDENAALLAFLADGEAWSSSALALALNVSQRTVQRALGALQAAGKAQAYGQGRSRLWTSPPVAGFATTLLLPGRLPTE